MTSKWMSPLVAAATVLMVLTYQCDAKNYKVGGNHDGWQITTYTPYFPQNERNVKAGDTLEFIYNSVVNNVVMVNTEDDFINCTTTGGYTNYTGGDNTIELAGGWNYFITTNRPAACVQYQMKIKVEAK